MGVMMKGICQIELPSNRVQTHQTIRLADASILAINIDLRTAISSRHVGDRGSPWGQWSGLAALDEQQPSARCSCQPACPYFFGPVGTPECFYVMQVEFGQTERL